MGAEQMPRVGERLAVPKPMANFGKNYASEGPPYVDLLLRVTFLGRCPRDTRTL